MSALDPVTSTYCEAPATQALSGAGRTFRLISFHWILVAAFAVALHAVPTIRYVGQGVTCNGPNDHPTLDAALVAAAFSSEADEIRLTSTVSYVNVSAHLTDWSPSTTGTVSIVGGYSDCDDTTSSGRSVIDGPGSGPIIEIDTSTQSSSLVTLRNLELTGAGRGVLVENGGSAYLYNVYIHDTQGGIQATGATAYVYADENTLVRFNTVPGDGGGLLCTDGAFVALFGADLRDNGAQKGGGAALESGCQVDAYPGTSILDNVASISGGGIYLDDAIFYGLGDDPRVEISNNDAAVDGGGLYANNSTAELTNTIFFGNTASLRGGGIAAFGGSTVYMLRVPTCALTIGCSELLASELTSGSEGLAAYASTSMVHLENTLIDFHRGGAGTLLHATGPSGRMVVNGARIWDNHVGAIFGGGNGGKVEAQYVSAARNFAFPGGIQQDTLIADMAFGSTLGLDSSVFDDVAGATVAAGATVDSLHCLILDDSTGLSLAGTDSLILADPGFVDANVGNLRPIVSSPIVDNCDATLLAITTEADIDLQPRGQDQQGNPQTGSRFFDVGFDEFPETPLFADGFESGDTSAWSATIP
jgi:hypothetical protein